MQIPPGGGGLLANTDLPDPQKPLTPGRYERLTSDTRTLYTPTSPILIVASALLKDTQTGAILAQARFKNISKTPVSALVVDIYAQDITGTALPGVENFQYLDMNIQCGTRFGSKFPIYLPDARTRSFSLVVRRVVFLDGSFWEPAPEARRWEEIPAQQKLSEALGSAELVEQYRRDTNEKARFVPAAFLDL